MTIKIGDKIVDCKIMVATKEGPASVQTADLFANGNIAMFAVPGAFTPTCSAKHLPSYLHNARYLKAKGIDKIICMSVNDAFVMSAWAKDQGVKSEFIMLADGNGDFAKALGLELDGRGFGLGIRSQRFSLITKNGILTHLFVEQGGEYKVSSAEYMLANI